MPDPRLTDPHLQSHFRRIQRQPASVQPILLKKLSCSLRLPSDEVEDLYQQFCQQLSLS